VDNVEGATDTGVAFRMTGTVGVGWRGRIADD
jgi:hypothetical protein